MAALGLPATIRHLFVSWPYALKMWRPLTTDGMRGIKDRYFNRMAEGPVFRLHDLRHAYAIYTLRNGGDLLDIQAQLGHKDIKTTSIYLRADNEDRGKRHKKSSPLDNLG